MGWIFKQFHLVHGSSGWSNISRGSRKTHQGLKEKRLKKYDHSPRIYSSSMLMVWLACTRNGWEIMPEERPAIWKLLEVGRAWCCFFSSLPNFSEGLRIGAAFLIHFRCLMSCLIIGTWFGVWWHVYRERFDHARATLRSGRWMVWNGHTSSKNPANYGFTHMLTLQSDVFKRVSCSPLFVEPKLR